MVDIYKKYAIVSKFLDKSISLTNQGIGEVCWNYKDAKEVINYLYNNNCIILGGDVLKKVNDKFLYTYDNWFISDTELSDEECLKISFNHSIEYIEDYVEFNGEDFYFVIVYKKIDS